jgi:RNA polymerase sigma-70 factor (ECF subfamily)
LKDTELGDQFGELVRTNFRRHQENIFVGTRQQKDPYGVARRIEVMLAMTLDKPLVPRPIHGRDESRPLSLNAPDLSQQTVWMIAVRDKRDRAAFAALFDHFAPRLKGFIMRSGTPAQQAEEIVQDVMLTIWRKAAMFDPHRAQVSAWIYQIARNRQIDIARKEKRPVPEELKEEPGTERDASQILGLEQEAGQLKQALAKLNPEQREIIEKAYLGELTHQEISAQTGLPLGTIKSRIRLGLERLRHELKDLYQ